MPQPRNGLVPDEGVDVQLFGTKVMPEFMG
jgi:hypothetical protein